MVRFPQKRPLFIVLAVCFVLAALTAEIFVFTHADHDCEGGACPVCLQMEIAQNILKGLVLAAAWPCLAFHGGHKIKNLRRHVTRPFAPVVLNIKSTT
jgi:hypothetical protein